MVLGLSANTLQGQNWDTLRVMTYNLLYYGEITSFCTSSNNDINDKDIFFETIAKHVQPDLLLVNEMGASIVYADRIIENVLNTDGVNRYKRAPIQNNSFSDIVNGVFYDRNKLVLLDQDKITQATNGSNIVRAIDVCTFYYKDPLLEEVGDTTYLYLVGMHLKAGGTSSDQDARDIAAESIMEYLEDNYPAGNYILAGDLNIGGSSEGAFQNFTSNAYGDFRFYDPLISGGWSSSSSFAYAHTQSTHTSSDCHSGGGLDDRFDLILLSGQIMEDTGNVEYIEDSYVNVGNDGNHYNQNLLQGSNNSVPSGVLGALYEMSDHLPVRLDIRVKQLELDSDTIPTSVPKVAAVVNPIIRMVEGQLWVDSTPSGSELWLTDMQGRVVMKKALKAEESMVDLRHLRGIFAATIIADQGRYTQKVVVP